MLFLATTSLIAIAVTSVLSGILGMGGGIILMGILTMTMPVAGAMVLHGATQLTANGSRAAMLWKDVQGQVVLPYMVGAVISLGLFALVSAAPPKYAVYLALGSFPFLARVLPKSWALDITKPWHAGAAGVIVMALQLLAGASGPALDVFFLNGKLSRHAVVATKATTQALSHAMKLVAYAPLASGLAGAGTAPPWLLVAAALTALAGTYAGRRLLDRMSDATFRRASTVLVLGIGAVYLVSGFYLMLQPALASP